MPADEARFDWDRVLVVDDDGLMLRTIGQVLAAHGLHPVLIQDPLEGLRQARESMPAMLVVDLIMPQMSGLELVERLRRHYGRACPPVLLLSANAARLSSMECIMFDGIVSKPFSISRMAREVAHLIGDHRQRAALSS